MHKIILITLAVCWSSLLAAQNIKQYVLQFAAPINSNHPDSVDFADLGIIGDAISDSRIVLIGEQGHGDAPAFLAKTRLIKYLHEKKGFNVIAFESDFFGLNIGWDYLAMNKQAPDSFLKNNVYPVWSSCDAVQNLLYSYIPQTMSTSQPLQVSGFDSQLILQFSARNLAAQMDSMLRSHELPVTKELNYKTEIIPLVDSLTKGTLVNRDQYAAQLAGLSKIREQLSTKISQDNFWLMLVDNLIASNNQYRLGRSTESNNIRDRQMALNILWLAQNKYPSQKIIVWAHNTHISKFAGQYNNKLLNQNKWMGSVLEELKDSSLKSYTIGFTSYSGIEGNLGRLQKRPLQAPEKNSFENWINESYNFAFVDFTKFNMANPHMLPTFAMKGHHHTDNLKAAWTKVFDGVFFTRDMYPCKRIPIHN